MEAGRFFGWYLVCICYNMHTLPAILSRVKTTKSTKTATRRFWNQIQLCWPALKGSLAQVRKPCVRPHCPACASGKKHPNYLLTFAQGGKRRCLYVPVAMVAQLKRALANGRRIEQLLYQMGPALIKEYRAANPAQTGPAVALKHSPAKKRPTKS